jgi:short-subunit dehydrogenase
VTRKVKDSVVVITGASSGIGRAAALAFAEQGATVVLAARREQALQEVADQCNKVGGRALLVPTDVTDEQQVQDLAKRAIESFGRIDTWVNNAAVTLFARFEESPLDIYRRVFETNFMGTVHGTRAVLPYMREQGSGTIVNVSSIVGVTGQPYTSAYVSSKAAILGFTESLRMEFALDGAKGIQACAVLPATVDTPFFQHAANYTGRATKAMNPVYPASDVAKVIVDLARKPKREVRVGVVPKMAGMQRLLMPGLMERTYSRMVDRDHLADEAAAPTPGNVFEPMAEWASVGGDWLPPDASSGSKLPMLAAIPAVGAVAAGAFAVRRMRNNRNDNGRQERQKQQDDSGVLGNVMRRPVLVATAVGAPLIKRFR